MAINKNHEFEELNGVKCAIVEKNASQERVDFLQPLLEFNNYTVVIQASTPPKVAPAPIAAPAAEGAAVVETPAVAIPAPPETFTIGVSDVMFNVTNAIFGRLLKTKRGSTVTLAYWKQKEQYPHDQIPYYENANS